MVAKVSRRIVVDGIVVVGFVAVAAVMLAARQREGEARVDTAAATPESEFARAGLRLASIDTATPEGRAGRTVTVGVSGLAAHQLFLRRAGRDDQWVHVDGQGQVVTGQGVVATARRDVELLVVPSAVMLFVDDVPVLTDTDGWDVSWVLGAESGPAPRIHPIPLLAVRDDFMRESLEVHPYAKVTDGEVSLAQRGGGMATTSEEMANASFQRAVNPFSIHASAGGRLTYNVPGAARWGDSHAEACFYFGIPKTGPVVDRDTLPAGTDMLVGMGSADGQQVAFGWSGEEQCFVLRSRMGDAPWTVLARWQEKRPALTNWVTIALECRQGHRVSGLLDGAPVVSGQLPKRLRGPFHVQGGAGLAEFDDVRAWSLPDAEPEPVPLLIRSRQFAGKERKDKRDSDGFGEWSSSAHAFRQARWRDAVTRAPCTAIMTGAAIIGGFVCESPGKPSAEVLSGLRHRIALYAAKPEGTVDVRKDSPLCTVRVRRSEGGWIVRRGEDGYVGPAEDLTVPQLMVGRRVDGTDRLCLRSGDRWLPMSDPVPGAVHLAVIRTVEGSSRRRFLLPPDPARHIVRCTSLVHELFEEAPSAWNWVDGAFRMDCRWACEDQWNFMACGSTGLPYMTSKRVFTGDQVHDAFMCFRATFPWDAGDTTFQYDSAADRANRFQDLAANKAWYNRHDLNVSFCSDGRDPLSGYCVVFAGEGNTVTRLLRRGVVVAESKAPEHLLPQGESFMEVHWPWWRFSLIKTGARVRVRLDGEPLFDYTDPEPIEGGHLGFWSVRNGFAISRVSSMAEGIAWKPHAFYVTGSTERAWVPLVRDAVHVKMDAEAGLTQVRNTFGGGFFAVRHVPANPVDLSVTPRLVLPLRLGDGVQVSLHLEIGGKPFIVRIGECPLAGIKAFLVPGSERGECFQLAALPESVVKEKHCLGELDAGGGTVDMDLHAALRKLRGDDIEPLLTCLTVGNSSNAGYLQAGCGGNAAGATYEVGQPQFR